MQRRHAEATAAEKRSLRHELRVAKNRPPSLGTRWMKGASAVSLVLSSCCRCKPCSPSKETVHHPCHGEAAQPRLEVAPLARPRHPGFQRRFWLLSDDGQHTASPSSSTPSYPPASVAAVSALSCTFVSSAPDQGGTADGRITLSLVAGNPQDPRSSLRLLLGALRLAQRGPV